MCYIHVFIYAEFLNNEYAFQRKTLKIWAAIRSHTSEHTLKGFAILQQYFREAVGIIHYAREV